jgi:diguanylate cyclase (GGDEF)-like protein
LNSDAPQRPPPEAPEGAARVLVVDDDRSTREQLAALLRGEGHLVEMCEEGAEALTRVAQGGIDLVLLDVIMPKMSGTETCRLLKGMAQGAFLPIILVTGRNDAGSRVEGLRIGADDYVGKPFDPDELSARVAGMLRIRRLMGGLAEDRERLLKRAVHDELTGMPNRRHFENRLAEERKRAERHHEPFACVLIDIEGATTLRSERSASFFDRLVVRCANALKKSVREGDLVARHADAVFAALLPHTHFMGAIAATERLLRDVGAAIGNPEDPQAGISIGASLFPSRDSRTAETLLQAAESALEEARRAGGGHICILQQRKYIYTPSGTRSERPPPPGRSEPPESDPSTPR